MSRNTLLLAEIASVSHQPLELDRLEARFQNRLIVDAGNTDTVAAYASELRLQITPEECHRVLDRLAETNAVAITIDQVETAINDLFKDRFIEPS